MPSLPCVKSTGSSTRPLELDPRPTISWPLCTSVSPQVKRDKDSTSSQNYYCIKWFNSSGRLSRLSGSWHLVDSGYSSHSTLVKRGYLSSHELPLCWCLWLTPALLFSNIDPWASQCSDASGLEHSVLGECAKQKPQMSGQLIPEIINPDPLIQFQPGLSTEWKTTAVLPPTLMGLLANEFSSCNCACVISCLGHVWPFVTL